MAGPSDRRARLLASLYGTYGEAATWKPQGGQPPFAVIIRRRGGEDLASFGDSQAIVTVGELRVRRSEVGAPERGDLIAITETGETLRVGNAPRLTTIGTEWLIEPIEVQAP